MSLYHVKLKVFTGVYQVDKIFLHTLYLYLEPMISKKKKLYTSIIVLCFIDILEIPMTSYIVVKFVCMMQTASS